MYEILETPTTSQYLMGFTVQRGVLAPIFAEAPKRAIKFSFNEKYKNAFRGEDGSLPLWAPSAAGALAGTTECSVNTPAEVISRKPKSYIAKPKRSLYRGANASEGEPWAFQEHGALCGRARLQGGCDGPLHRSYAAGVEERRLERCDNPLFLLVCK